MTLFSGNNGDGIWEATVNASAYQDDGFEFYIQATD
jgi:hypothetical protein